MKQTNKQQPKKRKKKNKVNFMNLNFILYLYNKKNHYFPQNNRTLLV